MEISDVDPKLLFLEGNHFAFGNYICQSNLSNQKQKFRIVLFFILTHNLLVMVCIAIPAIVPTGVVRADVYAFDTATF